MRHFLTLILIAGFIRANAQEAPWMRNFPPAEYAAQNQNWALTQSTEGWLYAGNNAGLLEFDGIRWNTFFLPEKQTVRSVATGNNGEIFCGGFAEFGFWQTGADGRLVYFSLSDSVRADLLGQEEIWHILAGDHFVLFQSFSTVYKYDYHTVTVLRPPEAVMFAQRVDGRIYLPVIGRGIFELLPDNTFLLTPGSTVLADQIVQFIVSEPGGGLRIGTASGGIFVLRNGQCAAWNNALNADFRRYQPNKALRLRDGGWAIGTILNGVYILDADDRLRYHLNRANGMQNNTVLAMLEDRSGNLWMGLDRGIDLCALRSPLRFYTDQSGRIGTVYAAARHSGRLYIGSNQGVFVRGPGEEFQLIEGTQGQVWQLEVFNNQLLCGHNTGTFAIEGKTARIISNVTGGWYAVRLPGRDDVLVQGAYTGLVVFRRDPSRGNWVFSHRVGGLTQSLKKVLFDRNGYLWGVHPNKGLFRVRLTPDLMQVEELRRFTAADGLPSEYQLGLAMIGDNLMLNTDRGVFRLETDQQRVVFRPVTTSNRQKWLSGWRDSYFAVDSSGVRLIGENFSLPLALPLVPSFENVVLLDSDEYLFCLENGFALLDAQTAADWHASPTGPPVIRLVESPGGRSWRPRSGQKLDFEWRENSLRFSFALPASEWPAKFSWRLDGFSTQWSPAQQSAEKEFTNLPSGEYAFRVRNEGGTEEATVRFRIAPPWYRSWWAAFCYVIAALAFLAILEKYNRQRLERQRRNLEAEAARELARQRAEGEREILELEVENKSRELSNAALNLIRKNEILQRLKDELLGAGDDPRALQRLARLIDRHLESDHDWEVFEESFNRVHDDFFKRLMHDFADLTPGDLRLAAYLKMNLSSKEIAPLLNISVRGVENKRYRLRKKLGLPEDANLTEFMMNF